MPDVSASPGCCGARPAFRAGDSGEAGRKRLAGLQTMIASLHQNLTPLKHAFCVFARWAFPLQDANMRLARGEIRTPRYAGLRDSILPLKMGRGDGEKLTDALGQNMAVPRTLFGHT